MPQIFSAFGSLLFFLRINNFANDLKSKVKIFVDDISLFSGRSSLSLFTFLIVFLFLLLVSFTDYKDTTNSQMGKMDAYPRSNNKSTESDIF